MLKNIDEIYAQTYSMSLKLDNSFVADNRKYCHAVMCFPLGWLL